MKLADMPICSFAAAGNCPYGEECPHMHGDLCAFCGKMCLHPYRPDERQEHIKLCEKNHKRLEALKRSQEIECSVCLDRVLSKPTAAERKFGLLSECDHPFCISCIRNWRGNSPTSGMDVNSALRACPICRKLSYYVIQVFFGTCPGQAVSTSMLTEMAVWKKSYCDILIVMMEVHLLLRTLGCQTSSVGCISRDQRLHIYRMHHSGISMSTKYLQYSEDISLKSRHLRKLLLFSNLLVVALSPNIQRKFKVRCWTPG
ncbi:hypothetical protein ZWY2020_053226 [Hordeum vulgare]|nr:hypothetical protein ZWY2020_053226 [Hordeum vulgare]